MRLIEAWDVDEALDQGIQYLAEEGVRADSRNGPVLKAPGPVVTHFPRPQNRVITDPYRDANPFFHLFEALWMLGGRQDVEFVEKFNSNIARYSDDGQTFHGAYGYRWMYHFGVNQLREVTTLLQREPETRRAVIAMWDPAKDLNLPGLDFPCNTTITFTPRTDGNLDMLVNCRSNDMIWGAYGANVVHMTGLHEYVARASNFGIGSYYQVSADFHAYEEVFNALIERRGIRSRSPGSVYGSLLPTDLITSPIAFPGEVEKWLTEPETERGYLNDGLNIATSLAQVWHFYKKKQWADALEVLQLMPETDWRNVATAWIVRRAPA